MSKASTRTAFSVLVTAIITWALSAVIIFVPKSTCAKVLFFIVGLAVILALFGFFLLYEKKLICVRPVKKAVASWRAKRTSRTAGRSERRLWLSGRRLKRISACISSSSPHWRGGIILSRGRELNEYNFANPDNIVFHVGRNHYGSQFAGFPIYSLNDRLVVTLYHGQNADVTSPPRRTTEPTIPEQELPDAVASQIRLELEVVDPRFHYAVSADGFKQSMTGDEYRDISDYLEDVFLAAWGDQEEYEVKFSDIEYETFPRGDRSLWKTFSAWLRNKWKPKAS